MEALVNMQSWEYTTTGYLTPEDMNRMGADGWELVSVTAHVPVLFGAMNNTGVYTLFFKRPIGDRDDTKSHPAIT